MPHLNDGVTRKRKPDWIRKALKGEQGGVHRGCTGADGYSEVAQIVKENALATICSSGMCPNRATCWGRRTATLMILGDVCTRSCRFCATGTGKPLPPSRSEPERVARSIRSMGLRHAVVTSVTRDDLPDGGAAHWAAVIEAIREHNPQTSIEVLVPDMDGRPELLDIILAARPDIVGHNIETVSRLTPQVRSRARYEVSLAALRHIADSGAVVKSGIMVGLGETEDEVFGAMDDLRAAGCSILTIGQYLQPSHSHIGVAEYVTPEQFERYGEQARARGFSYVASAPLVRSSFMAEEALKHIG